MAYKALKFAVSAFFAHGGVCVPRTVQGRFKGYSRGFMNGFYYMRVSEAHNYTENGEGVPICRGIGLVDLDTSIVTQATIVIEPLVSGDVLELPRAKLLSGQPGDDLVVWLPDANGIAGTYDGKKSLLTLSGGATREKYENTLRSILFWSTSEDPAEMLRTDGRVACAFVLLVVAGAGVGDIFGSWSPSKRSRCTHAMWACTHSVLLQRLAALVVSPSASPS